MLAPNHRHTATILTTVALHTSWVESFCHKAIHADDTWPLYLRAFVVWICLYYGTKIGATLPDIDQRLKGIYHRGITHSIWFVLFFLGLTLLFFVDGLGIGDLVFSIPGYHSLIGSLYLGITLGIIAHLLMDYCSACGIDPFYPLFGFDEINKGTYTIRYSRFPHPSLYKVGKPFLGMTEIVWYHLARLSLLYSIYYWCTHII